MGKSYKTTIDLIHMLLLLCLSFAISVLIYQYSDQKLSYLPLVINTGVLILCYLGNRILHNIFLYLLLHIGLFVGLLYQPIAITGKVICILFFLFLFVFDLMYWSNHTLAPVFTMPLPVVAVFPVIYVYMTIKGFTQFLSIIYVIGVLFLSLSILLFYLANTRAFIDSDNDKGYVPINDIVKSNNFFVFGITGFVFLSTVLLNSNTLERIFRTILNGIGKFFSSVLAWFFGIFRGSEHATPDPMIEESVQESMELLPLDEPSLFAKIIDILIRYVFTIALILLVIGGLSYAIYTFIRRYYKHNTTTRKISLTEVIQTKEQIKPKKHLKKKEHLIISSNNERVRHYYRKKLKQLRADDLLILNSMTPNELTKQVADPLKYNFEVLTNIYNKARYSNVKISSEEVKIAKSSLRSTQANGN